MLQTPPGDPGRRSRQPPLGLLPLSSDSGPYLGSSGGACSACLIPALAVLRRSPGGKGSTPPPPATAASQGGGRPGYSWGSHAAPASAADHSPHTHTAVPTDPREAAPSHMSRNSHVEPRQAHARPALPKLAADVPALLPSSKDQVCPSAPSLATYASQVRVPMDGPLGRPLTPNPLGFQQWPGTRAGGDPGSRTLKAKLQGSSLSPHVQVLGAHLTLTSRPHDRGEN